MRARPGRIMNDPKPQKDPHILIVGGSLGDRNGISRVVSDLSWGFGDKAIVVASVDPEKIAFKICDKSRILISRQRRKNDLVSLSLPRVVRSIMRKNDALIVLSHDLSSAVYSAFMKILTMRRVVRISAFVYDTREIRPRKWPAERRQNIKLVLFKMLLRIGVIDDVLVLDSRVADTAMTALRTRRVKVVRIGVSQSVLESAREGILKKPASFVEKGEFVIFFHGILIPRRRIEDLISAFGLMEEERGSKAGLYVGGSLNLYPEYVELVRQMIEQLRLANKVNLMGVLSDEELAFMYNRCDLFVFPCDEQTWGLAPLEAMVFGKPTIVSTGSGVSEVLDPNISVLVPPKNPKMIRDAIIELMEDDKRRKQLGMKAREHVTSKLTFANTVQDLKDFWNLKS
jgi:glycosyltransferase involved in cell wall biosynthesis